MDIRVENLNKSFNGKQVLKDLNINFPKGKITCLMGASGTGKTTLANILMNLLKPDSGRVEGLEGKKISAVFQEDRLIEHWDAIENIRLVNNLGLTKEKINEHLKEINLKDYEEKPVRLLSGGMRRRVALVRAILSDYDVLILDEPFKGLDEELKKQVINYIRKMAKGKTVIIITHDREDIDLLDANLISLP
ncbi:MAG: ABC transporter ATP-binding protein [Clostridiales bacterium]|nr:ABC transporter ATP-binding protein [Clostridiales bacterium]